MFCYIKAGSPNFDSTGLIMAEKSAKLVPRTTIAAKIGLARPVLADTTGPLCQFCPPLKYKFATIQLLLAS